MTRIQTITALYQAVYRPLQHCTRQSIDPYSTVPGSLQTITALYQAVYRPLQRCTRQSTDHYSAVPSSVQVHTRTDLFSAVPDSAQYHGSAVLQSTLTTIALSQKAHNTIADRAQWHKPLQRCPGQRTITAQRFIIIQKLPGAKNKNLSACVSLNKEKKILFHERLVNPIKFEYIFNLDY